MILELHSAPKYIALQTAMRHVTVTTAGHLFVVGNEMDCVDQEVIADKSLSGSNFVAG